jgi:hypothetical protein
MYYSQTASFLPDWLHCQKLSTKAKGKDNLICVFLLSWLHTLSPACRGRYIFWRQFLAPVTYYDSVLSGKPQIVVIVLIKATQLRVNIKIILALLCVGTHNPLKNNF